MLPLSTQPLAGNAHTGTLQIPHKISHAILDMLDDDTFSQQWHAASIRALLTVNMRDI